MEQAIEAKGILPEQAAQQFSEILRDAITSYIENKEQLPVLDWLKSYLHTQLPERSMEDIIQISREIVTTITSNDEKCKAVQDAVAQGQSAENWFAKDVSAATAGMGNGSIVQTLAACDVALTKAGNAYVEPEDMLEVTDVEVIPPEAWNDEQWNTYQVKELLLDTAKQAGTTALRTTASDLYSRITEQGFRAVLSDQTLISESLLSGASAGIKAATSGALQIATDRCVLPEIPDRVPPDTLARIACVAVENVKIFSRVANGELTLSEALIQIKNTTIATVASIIGQTKGTAIGATMGMVFGPVGSMAGGFIGGAIGKFAGTKVGTAITNAAKKVGSAAKTAVRKIASGVKSIGSKIRNFFR